MLSIPGYPWSVLAVTGIVLVLIWAGPSLWKWATTPKAAVVPVDSTDPDVADMMALKRLTARAQRQKCPESIAACQVIGTHFFHEQS
jgi:hypothetical protein